MPQLAAFFVITFILSVMIRRPRAIHLLLRWSAITAVAIQAAVLAMSV